MWLITIHTIILIAQQILVPKMDMIVWLQNVSDPVSADLHAWINNVELSCKVFVLPRHGSWTTVWAVCDSLQSHNTTTLCTRWPSQTGWLMWNVNVGCSLCETRSWCCRCKKKKKSLVSNNHQETFFRLQPKLDGRGDYETPPRWRKFFWWRGWGSQRPRLAYWLSQAAHVLWCCWVITLNHLV